MTRRKPASASTQKSRAKAAADRAQGKRPKRHKTTASKGKEPTPGAIPETTERELRKIAEEAATVRDKRIGNEFWKARSSHGPGFKYNADTLAEACEEYFQWVADHPIYESKPFAFQGSITWADVPKMRATTLEGLCVFLQIGRKAWRTYRENNDLSPVTTWAEGVMDTQKLTGAMADQLNPNIVARYIGLRDNTSTELTGKDGGPIKTEGDSMSNVELARRAGFMLGQAIEKMKEKSVENEKMEDETE